MRKIFTITGNLLAETTAVFDMPKAGETARAKGTVGFQVGGKGVNVAKIALELDANATAAIFPAGEIGERCLKYLHGKIPVLSVKIEGQTREGLVCIDSKNGVETTYLGADVPVDEIAFDKMIKLLSENISPSDIIALCGSFPSWKESYAEKLLTLRDKTNCLLCLDTYGAPLDNLVFKGADMLKINRHEFISSLCRPRGLDKSDLIASISELKNAAKIVAVSDGGNPSIFCDGQKIFTLQPPPVDVVSATGCGDAMFASLIIDIFIKNISLEDAAKKALFLASKAATSREITIR